MKQLPFIDIPLKLYALYPNWENEKVLAFKTINLMQSYRYFYGARSQVLLLLQNNKDENEHVTFEVNEEQRNDVNICVHIRRGDFIYQELHQHSTFNFTLHATRFLLKKERRLGSRLRLIVFGNDHNWARQVFSQMHPALLDYSVKEDFVPSDWREVPCYDKAENDIPLTMRNPILVSFLNWLNHYMRKYISLRLRI